MTNSYFSRKKRNRIKHGTNEKQNANELKKVTKKNKTQIAKTKLKEKEK